MIWVNKVERQASRLLFSFRYILEFSPVVLFITGGLGYIFYLPINFPEWLDWTLRFFFDANALPLIIIGAFYPVWNILQKRTYWLLWLVWNINFVYALYAKDPDLFMMLYSLIIWCIFVFYTVSYLIGLNKAR